MRLRSRVTSVVILLGSAALMAAVAGCRKEPSHNGTTSAGISVQVAVASRETIRPSFQLLGIISAAPGADLLVIAPEPARVVSVLKNEGDSVTQGEDLLQLDQADVAAEELSLRPLPAVDEEVLPTVPDGESGQVPRGGGHGPRGAEEGDAQHRA